MSAGGFGQDYPDVEVPPPDHLVVGEPVFRRSWKPVDLSDVLDGAWKPAEPTVGRRADGIGLFYPGKVHTVSSESEGGKTWLVLAAVVHELSVGNHVVYVDFEDDEGGIVGRLLTLQVDKQAIRERFHYVRPLDALGSGIHLDDLGVLLRDVQPTLGIVDGVTEAMTLHGLDTNSNSDAATFGRMLPRRLADAGAASVSLDHVTKSAEGRGRYSLGAVHKLNALDGAAYVLENRNSFGVGITGRSTIRIAKDRPGQLRRHALSSSGGLHWFGDLVMASHHETWAELEVAAPVDTADVEFRPTHLMGAICAAIEKVGRPLSGTQIEAMVKGKATTIRQARALLEVEGYISDKTPFALLKPWDGGGQDD
ncbi:AAA family ATPase [Nocardioides sp. QY071]|uniref:AAA family ATPase n=1 Tax=Nocardioides sp. QY071 TaxID=3044187 RepID=UPI00249B5D02|nr:AAA family ATPase [Nocardioides sp. QY071]WGY04323.1 AAA family ATPase [Nocardioides sp. QY071]